MAPIHHCDWAGQPDIRIACDGSWSTPAWKSPEYPSGSETGIADVYRLDNGRLYTFARGKVTCVACLRRGEGGGR